jgi:hypothetical protein
VCAAATRDSGIHAPGAGWDDGEFLIFRRAIKTGLDGRAIIRRAIAKPAEIKGPCGLTVTQIFRQIGLGDVLAQHDAPAIFRPQFQSPGINSANPCCTAAQQNPLKSTH